MSEFLVSSWDRMGEKITADGRCTVGDLHVGDTFIALCRLVFEPPPETYSKPPVRTSVGEIRYRITGIIAYEQSLDSIEEGMTARLVLEVQKGFEYVAKGDALATE